jgi:hypothetical protein
MPLRLRELELAVGACRCQSLPLEIEEEKKKNGAELVVLDTATSDSSRSGSEKGMLGKHSALKDLYEYNHKQPTYAT